jgi:hypothetical protein
MKFVERLIVKQCIEELLSHGYTLSVNDGEKTTLAWCISRDTVFEAMDTTEEDYLYVHRPDEIEIMGWVRFIYGNAPEEVINDYSTNLEPFLTKTLALIVDAED